ncbi:MAG: NAD-dependent epimerase/dehydratase family protein [Polyangiales bacterium]
MIAVVTGGAGRLGNAVVRELLSRGHRVTVLDRPQLLPESIGDLKVEYRSVDVLDADAMFANVQNADVVFHLAAKIDLANDKDGSMFAVNVDGTRNVVRACSFLNKRLVFCSSHHALDLEPINEPLTENNRLGLEKKCDYHRSKAVAEQLVLEHCDKGLNATVVSPGSLIGPLDFDRSMIANALIDLYNQRIPIMMQVLSDYVDVRDVAFGIVEAAEKGRVGERYLLTGNVVPILDFVATFGEITGRPVPKRAFPLWVGGRCFRSQPRFRKYPEMNHFLPLECFARASPMRLSRIKKRQANSAFACGLLPIHSEMRSIGTSSVVGYRQPCGLDG